MLHIFLSELWGILSLEFGKGCSDIDISPEALCYNPKFCFKLICDLITVIGKHTLKDFSSFKFIVTFYGLVYTSPWKLFCVHLKILCILWLLGRMFCRYHLGQVGCCSRFLCARVTCYKDPSTVWPMQQKHGGGLPVPLNVVDCRRGLCWDCVPHRSCPAKPHQNQEEKSCLVAMILHHPLLKKLNVEPPGKEKILKSLRFFFTELIIKGKFGAKDNRHVSPVGYGH